MSRVFLFLFVLSVTVYAVTDCINADEEDRRGLPRGLWLILIIMLPIFGPVSWFVISSGQRRARMSTRGAGGGSGHGRGPVRPGRTGPVAPDDDPEFLWRIEQERRRAQEQQEQQDNGSAGDEGPAQ